MMLEDGGALDLLSNDLCAVALSDFVTELLLSEIDQNPLPVFLESNK